MRRMMLLAGALYTVVLASCASTGAPVATQLRDVTGQNGRACILKSDIKSYGVLKNNVVSINGVRKYYLATVLPGCTDLQTSARAMFSGKFGSVCGQTSDSITTRGNRCTIGQIFQFDNKDQAFDTYNSIVQQGQSMKSSAGSGSY